MELLKKDFEFIGEEMDEIASVPTSEYKVQIKKLVENAAFKCMIKL